MAANDQRKTFTEGTENKNDSSNSQMDKKSTLVDKVSRDLHVPKTDANEEEEMKMEGFKKIGDDLELVIEKEDSNSSVTTESEDGKQNKKPFRERLRHLLHTNKFQIGVVCLVIFDCLLVITELLIDLKILEVGGESPIPKILHYISISILCLFLIELMFKVYAMRLDFFKSKMEMFDAVVIIVSFALDVAFLHHEGVMSGIGLLIILRLWRVTRILNGIVMSVKIQAERKLAKEKRAREEVEQELVKFREYCTAQEKEIEILQGLLKKNGIEFERIEKPIVVDKINVVAEVNEIKEQDQEQQVQQIEVTA